MDRRPRRDRLHLGRNAADRPVRLFLAGMPLPTLSRILWALSTRRQTGAEPDRLIEQDYSTPIASLAGR
jgi:hypothetical protein